LHDGEEIKALLQQLAGSPMPREEKEKLHSRLLAGIPDKTTICDMSYKLIGSPQAEQGAEHQPPSHFSDSSDDESEGEASTDASKVYYRSRQEHRATTIPLKSPPTSKEPATTYVFSLDL